MFNNSINGCWCCGTCNETWNDIKSYGIAGMALKCWAEPELEDLPIPQRYYPDSLNDLCKATRFSEDEIKRIYRGFKAECPTGFVREETFKCIYSQFFPLGGKFMLCDIFMQVTSLPPAAHIVFMSEFKAAFAIHEILWWQYHFDIETTTN